MDDNTKTASSLLKKFFESFISKELEKENFTTEYLTLLKILWFKFDEIVVKTGGYGNYRKKFILQL